MAEIKKVDAKTKTPVDRLLDDATLAVPNAELIREHRYGDNPEHGSVLVKPRTHHPPGRGPLEIKVLYEGGKITSRTNDVDVLNTAMVARFFNNPGSIFADKSTVLISKHGIVASAAVGQSTEDKSIDLRKLAVAGDRDSAYGGLEFFTRAITEPLALEIVKDYREMVASPTVTKEALKIFQDRRPELRVYQVNNLDNQPCFTGEIPPIVQYYGFGANMMMSEAFLSSVRTPEELLEAKHQMETKGDIPKTPDPSYEQLVDGLIAFYVNTGIKSNSSVAVRGGATVFVFGGQPNRVDTIRYGVDRAKRRTYAELVLKTGKKEEDLDSGKLSTLRDIASVAAVSKSVLVTDSFFPMADGPQLAVEEKFGAVFAPLGSKYDKVNLQPFADAQVPFAPLPRHFNH